MYTLVKLEKAVRGGREKLSSLHYIYTIFFVARFHTWPGICYNGVTNTVLSTIREDNHQ